jgi:hypothetical protein
MVGLVQFCHFDILSFFFYPNEKLSDNNDLTSNHGHESQFLIFKSQRVDGGRIYILGVESKRGLIF